MKFLLALLGVLLIVVAAHGLVRLVPWSQWVLVAGAWIAVIAPPWKHRAK